MKKWRKKSFVEKCRNLSKVSFKKMKDFEQEWRIYKYKEKQINKTEGG